MEISIASIGTIVLAIVLIIVAWKWVDWLWLTPKRQERCLREQGFSGNSYRLFSGDWKENTKMLRLASSKPISFSDDVAARVFPFHRQCINKYGKNSFMWMGPTPSVLISNPDHIREILTNVDAFPKAVVNPIVRYISRGLSGYKGEKWIKHKKLVMPAFHTEIMKQMMPAFCQSCRDLVNEWQNLIPSEKSLELDAWPYVVNLTSDIISRTSFGSSYMDGRKIFEQQKEITQILMKVRQSVYIPGSRFLPSKTNRRMKQLDREIEFTLKRIINKRQEEMKAGKSCNTDLLGVLLKSNLDEIKQKGQRVGMTIEEVMEECKLFYFAGQETTSNLIVWAIILLAKHQEWQAAAREEVLRIFGNKEPDFDGLNHLKIVTMIMYEALRLYPPAVAIVRSIFEDTKLGNLSLPAGTQIFVPIMYIHRDPELWGDNIGEFRPERFSEGIVKATKGQLCFFPFGYGPRICIGQNFAMVEARIALAMILQHFSFELSPSYAHAPIMILTLNPQHGAHIILRKLA